MRTTFWMQARRWATLFFFLISLLAVLPAPNLFLWRFALVATELGHWLLLIPLILLRFETGHKIGRLYQILSIISVLLFISPAIRAHQFSHLVPETFETQLGHSPSPPPSPTMNWLTLWSLKPVPRVTIQPFTFTTRGGLKLTADYYHAEGTEKPPIIIAVHGGGWNSGNPQQLTALFHHLARRGFAVISTSYRLAPQYTWPAPKQDLLALISHLRSAQGPLGFEPKRFIFLGRSAGAQIVLATAYANKIPGLAGVIALYGPADLNFAYEFGEEDDILRSRSLLRDYLGGPPERVPSRYDDASAIRWVGPDTPPTLLLHGSRDELVWSKQSRRLETVLSDWRRPHALINLPWATHAFDFNLHGPGGQITTYAIDYFLSALPAK